MDACRFTAFNDSEYACVDSTCSCSLVAVVLRSMRRRKKSRPAGTTLAAMESFLISDNRFRLIVFLVVSH